VVLLSVFGDDLGSWFKDVSSSTVGLLGWGLVLLGLTIIVVIGVVWRRQLGELVHRWKLHRWNKWLGASVFVLSVWGILALFNLGGSFGQSLIGQDQGFNGFLRVLGLVTLGFILMAPRLCWQAISEFFSWMMRPVRKPAPPHQSSIDELGSRYKTPSYSNPTIARKSSHTEQITQPPPLLVPPELASTKMETAAEMPSPSAQVEPPAEDGKPPRDIKQVAQEVWRKYGEEPSLITVDGWGLPPIEILDHVAEAEFGEADNMKRAKIIEDALASYGVEAKVVQINAGPTVTQFGVEPGWDRKKKQVREKDGGGNMVTSEKEISRTRVKVERITSLSNDLALALASPSIRIEAPVPGKSIVGIEVPNSAFGVVSLRGVIETNAFQKILARSSLALAMGKGAGGEAVAGDLDRMPHLLIAGATGSGKTVCLNAVICCLLLNNTPNDVKFIMIDPKRVELAYFNSLPHLETPVIVDAQKALKALRWLSQQMDKRYQELAAANTRNIEAYNKGKEGDEKMPYIVLIIDELADLMMTGFDEVEHILCRLAQLARAVGIHLVVATQRPSVDVITGLIKANFPTRISFAVTSQVDSRTILDGGGAEKLLGRGDMLYMPTEAAKPKRLQGCYVSDVEVERLVYFWGSQRRDEALVQQAEELVPDLTGVTRDGHPKDPLLEAALQLAHEHENVSTSYLQRRLHIGYPRAARLMDQLKGELEEREEN
jgi:S-DNA-T family DNA segregation ATPase FtsK/SpoIIIE